MMMIIIIIIIEEVVLIEVLSKYFVGEIEENL
jgi:hypothetical protein